MNDLQAARRAFRDARHALGAAVLAGDDRATVATARRLLRAHDQLVRTAEYPSTRQTRALRRWRAFALAALRSDPPPPGLLDRARALVESTDNMRNSDGH